MSRKATLDRFIEKNPLAVMTRSIINSIIDLQFDRLFEEERQRQYDQVMKFSTLAVSVAEIALGTVENRNQAYRSYQEELAASKTAYYNKLNHTETGLSEAVVRHSAQRAGRLIEELEFQPWEVLPGYRCFTIDGNHLQKTEKRLKETRGLCAAPLPGTVVGRYDHQTGLFDRAYLLEDAHAQEASVLDRVAEDLESHDLLIADRHFCIVGFLCKVATRDGFFLIRQHGRLKGQLKGERRRIGRIDTGEVFEQKMQVRVDGQVLTLRRITVCLDEPTREGDTELHMLSNVPASDASACTLADMYRQRWEIENAFHVLTMTFNCETASNCHPRAALFQFCMAVVAYNCRQVLLAALYAEHEQEQVEQMSQYQVALDVVRPLEGMLTALTDEEWAELVPSTLHGLAQFLRHVSRHVNVKSYRKSVRGPKKPKPPRKRCKAGTHVSTAKLLATRKQRC
jgi:hypothetical protein